MPDRVWLADDQLFTAAGGGRSLEYLDMHDLRSMLDGIREIRDSCDLDLLLFFHRHPRALLTSEQLVAYIGYERDRVAKSLDGLIDAGLLTRSQNPSHAARLYVLKPGSLPDGLLARFLSVAATREGRQEALRLFGTAPKERAALRQVPIASVG